uniref:Uncharacterized protein n=1 Tax=Cacopsylla melanoneura TaxID=428564 RepID=A0A8D8QXC0_9HEMI
MRYVSELRTFENKILRKIYGPVCERGIWRIRKNKEIRDLFNEPDIIANIRCRRMRWTGHVLRRGSESLINNQESLGRRNSRNEKKRTTKTKMEGPNQEGYGTNQYIGRRSTRQDSLARQNRRGKKSSRLQMALAVSK